MADKRRRSPPRGIWRSDTDAHRRTLLFPSHTHARTHKQTSTHTHTHTHAHTHTLTYCRQAAEEAAARDRVERQAIETASRCNPPHTEGGLPGLCHACPCMRAPTSYTRTRPTETASHTCVHPPARPPAHPPTHPPTHPHKCTPTQACTHTPARPHARTHTHASAAGPRRRRARGRRSGRGLSFSRRPDAPRRMLLWPPPPPGVCVCVCVCVWR